jgi:hypothetical protein
MKKVLFLMRKIALNIDSIETILSVIIAAKMELS